MSSYYVAGSIGDYQFIGCWYVIQTQAAINVGESRYIVLIQRLACLLVDSGYAGTVVNDKIEIGRRGTQAAGSVF